MRSLEFTGIPSSCAIVISRAMDLIGDEPSEFANPRSSLKDLHASRKGTSKVRGSCFVTLSADPGQSDPGQRQDGCLRRNDRD